ncbi:chitinase class i family protein, partial [Photorhabdus asymbiotica]
VYANRLGNGDMESGDGMKYKGRGGIQLTGKDNYSGFNDFYKAHWMDSIDFLDEPSKLEEAVYCIRSAVYFWLRENLFKIADQGNDDSTVDKITAKINFHTDSYEERRKQFNRIIIQHIFDDAFK